MCDIHIYSNVNGRFLLSMILMGLKGFLAENIKMKNDKYNVLCEKWKSNLSSDNFIPFIITYRQKILIWFFTFFFIKFLRVGAYIFRNTSISFGHRIPRSLNNIIYDIPV